jgi:hypothetical protein
LASKGLRYTSETDAPLQSFVWKKGGDVNAKSLRERAGARPDTTVEETTLAAFFHAVPSGDKAKFQKLAQVLKERLSDIMVFKLGDQA